MFRYSDHHVDETTVLVGTREPSSSHAGTGGPVVGSRPRERDAQASVPVEAMEGKRVRVDVPADVTAGGHARLTCKTSREDRNHVPDPYEPPVQQVTPTNGVLQPSQAPTPAATPRTSSGLRCNSRWGRGLPMKQRHPVTAWLLWPLLTLGIYHLVWYYKIHKAMAEFDRRRAIPVAGPMLVLLFLGWTFVAPMISYYNCGTRIRNAQRAAGLNASYSPVVGMLLMLVFGVGTLYYQLELNKIIDAYGVPEGQQVPLWV